MQVTIYANYGTLRHEKEVVYSTVPAEINEPLTVEIPDAYVTVTDSVGITLDGMPYLLNEALANANMHGEAGKVDDRPVLRWYSLDDGYRTRNLTVVE